MRFASGSANPRAPPEEWVTDRDDSFAALSSEHADRLECPTFYESVSRRKDGSLVHVSVSNKAIRDASGNVQYFLCTKKDVTHLKVLRDAKLVDAKLRDLLVITDLVMPDREGIETIMDLRRVNPTVKIIAISGGGRVNPEVTLVMAQKLGARRTLAKPFAPRDLLGAVAEVLAEVS